MNEHELSQGMRSAVDGVSARPDLAEVELGAGRVRGRRRVATGVVAAMLVAGAGGTGFGIGRSLSGGDDAGELSAAAPTASTQPDAGEADAGASDGGAATRPGDASANVPLDPPGPRPTLPPGRFATDDAGDAAAVEFSDGDYLSSYYAPQPLTLIYERTLADGVRVRVQRGEPWADVYAGDDEFGPVWQPAGFCWGNAEMRITIDGADIVDLSGGSFYDELFRGVWFEATEVGWADDRPMRLVAVQADPGVTEATVRWEDGATDTAPLVDGIAVLAVPGTGAWELEYSVDLVDAGGTRTLTRADLDYQSDPDWRAGCIEPPPALPDAGDQPADPAAEEAAIAERFALLFDLDVDRSDKPDDLLDDWTGVADAVAAIEEYGYVEIVESATLTIDELVFTSPTEAWFRYVIDTDLTYFGERYGTATLTDGVWQFPRALMCQDLGLAGPGCQPWVDNIYPPSWYERYGYYEEGYYEECYEAEDGSEVCEGFNSMGSVPPPQAIPVPATTLPPPG